MPSSSSTVEIKFLKRQAKALVRTTSLNHAQALDRVAIDKGYANWSLLMKHNQSLTPSLPSIQRQPLDFVRTPEEMQQSLRKVRESRWDTKSRVDRARESVPDLSREFADARNAVQFAIAFLECLLCVPRFKIQASAPVNWEMRCWLPYSALPLSAEGPRILVNRRYKPLGQTSDEWATYEAWPNLHARIEPAQVARFSHSDRGNGFLFGDGCAPWLGRATAQRYLARLRNLEEALPA